MIPRKIHIPSKAPKVQDPDKSKAPSGGQNQSGCCSMCRIGPDPAGALSLLVPVRKRVAQGKCRDNDHHLLEPRHTLGVLLDPELSLEAQVTVVARNAFLQLRLINQLRPYLEYDCLATVTHALVTSRLDFCNALYVGLPLKTVRTLQLVQNRAARLLTGTGRYAHMTPVLRQLHWLPIEARAQFKVLIMTYKALNGLGPGYLNEHLRPYMPDHPLRSAGESLLREPSMKEIRRTGEDRMAHGMREADGSQGLTITVLNDFSRLRLCQANRADLSEKRDKVNSSISSQSKIFFRISSSGSMGELSHQVLVKMPEGEWSKSEEGPGSSIKLLNSDSLPELTEIISDLVLRNPRMLVLGDFNLHAETGLTRAAQDFMVSMTAIGLSQHVTGPTHECGHTLDLVFSTGQEEGDLKVRNLCLTPLSWSDHFLVKFVLESGLSLCKGADPIVWVRPRNRVDPD
ncbi:Autophagy-related protein 17 [Varanus komodoensis]|nr:Autophagy-related protein 17 [Varanus komodoensis]